VPTERETYVLGKDLPVFRVLYRRNALPPPTLALLEERLGATDNPG
jgi:tRNA (guanine-N7-)-methyltransferase